MFEPLNAVCFVQPHWRVIAAGYNTESWFSDGEGVGTGGIVNPQPVHLPVGHYYYRFANSTSSRSAQLGGGWWIEFEEFAKIRAFAGAHGYSLKEAARLMLALPYSWTKVDLLVRALLAKPLKAYAGLGKPAQAPAGGADKGTRWVPTQHMQIRQLYLPGLFVQGTPHGERQLWEIAFAQPAQVEPIR